MKFLFNNRARVELPDGISYLPSKAFDGSLIILFDIPDGEYEKFVFNMKEQFPTVKIEGNKFIFLEDDLFVSKNLPVKENQPFCCFGITGISTGFGVRDEEGKFFVTSKTLNGIDAPLNKVFVFDEKNHCLYPLLESELITS